MSDSKQIAKSLLAGSASGVMAIAVVHPMDTIRTRLQTTSASQFRGAIDCATKTLAKEGVKGFYKGMAFPLCAQGLYKSIMFGGFEASQMVLKKFKTDKSR